MHLLAWLDALGAADISAPGAASRRVALTRLGRAALTAVPVAAFAPAAVAGPPRITSVITDALNLVLRVARAQFQLAGGALAADTPPDAAARALIRSVRDLTQDLIARVENSIQLSGDELALARTYDFTGNRSTTGGGPLNPADYDQLLLLAQVFADTLSRTLLSSLGVFSGNTAFAELAGQLVGTSSRLAGLIRLARQARGHAVQPWIVEAEGATNLPFIFTTTTTPYAGEDSTVIYSPRLELTATGAINDPATTPRVLPDPLPARTELTAAFDQPLPLASGETLPEAAVTQLLAPFIVV